MAECWLIIEAASEENITKAATFRFVHALFISFVIKKKPNARRRLKNLFTHDRKLLLNIWKSVID